MGEQLPEISVRTTFYACICFGEEVVENAGEAVVIVEATEAGRDAECAGEIGRARVSAYRALLNARMRIEGVGEVVKDIVAATAGVDAIGILSVEVGEFALGAEN